MAPRGQQTPGMQSNNRLLLVLSLLVIALAVTSLIVGSQSIDLKQALADQFNNPDSASAIILREIRFPRMLISIVIGASLGVCGAAMQGLLQNPLASPGLVGSASGAALGAVSVLYFSTSIASIQLIPIAGMLGSLMASLLVYLLAGRSAGITTLILAGVAVNSLATAGLSLLLNLAPSPYAAQELILWTLGDLSDRSFNDLWQLLPCTLLGWALLLGIGQPLNTLTLGESTAKSLGVRVNHLRWRVFIAVALSVGAAVSVAGMIGFIGLVVPHLLRPFVKHEPARLLSVSALGGAAMLLAADIGVRLIPTQQTLKVGVLTALVGAPFFFYLILRTRKQYHG